MWRKSRKISVFFLMCFLWFHRYLRMINLFFLADSGDASFPLTKKQQQVPFAECPAPGLEPFRELEELAAQLAEAKLPAATAAAAATASAVPKVAPAQPKGHPVAPAQAKVPPAVPPLPVPPISRPEGVGLSHEERALRSLLEFFACSDVERKGQDALFNCKYREFLGANESNKTFFSCLVGRNQAEGSIKLVSILATARTGRFSMLVFVYLCGQARVNHFLNHFLNHHKSPYQQNISLHKFINSHITQESPHPHIFPTYSPHISPHSKVHPLHLPRPAAGPRWRQPGGHHCGCGHRSRRCLHRRRPAALSGQRRWRHREHGDVEEMYGALVPFGSY